jgi:hypothetical protein
LARHFAELVFVLGVAGRATGLLHVRSDHRDDGVVGDPPLAGTVIVQNVTKPKLTLLHRILPRNLWRGKRVRKAGQY